MEPTSGNLEERVEFLEALGSAENTSSGREACDGREENRAGTGQRLPSPEPWAPWALSFPQCPPQEQGRPEALPWPTALTIPAHLLGVVPGPAPAGREPVSRVLSPPTTGTSAWERESGLQDCPPPGLPAARQQRPVPHLPMRRLRHGGSPGHRPLSRTNL